MMAPFIRGKSIVQNIESSPQIPRLTCNQDPKIHCKYSTIGEEVEVKHVYMKILDIEGALNILIFITLN